MNVHDIDRIQNPYIRDALKLDPRTATDLHILLSGVYGEPVTFLTPEKNLRRAFARYLAKISPENTIISGTKDREYAERAFKKLNVIRDNYFANLDLKTGIDPQDFPENVKAPQKEWKFQRLLRRAKNVLRRIPQRAPILAIADQRAPVKAAPAKKARAEFHRAALFPDTSSVTVEDVMMALNLQGYAAHMPQHMQALYKRRPDLVAPTLKHVLVRASENRVFEEYIDQLLDTVVDLIVQNKVLLGKADFVGIPPSIANIFVRKVRAVRSEFTRGPEPTGQRTEQPRPTQKPAEAPIRKSPQVTKGIGYSVYTEQFDEVVRPQALAAVPELEQLEQYIDRTVHQFDPNFANSQAFTKQLSAGVRRRLRDKGMKPEDTIVTLLLDNSGSLRGKGVFASILTTTHVALALEMAKVKTEILGYTTARWKGGHSRQLWIAEGKSFEPGRLNDLRHVVYKKSEQTWAEAKINLALMAKEGFLKENIDGEALLWARDRLAARVQTNQILLLVNDGAPTDDSTMAVNRRGYLDRHFEQVAMFMDERTPINLGQIFIGNERRAMESVIRNRTSIPDEIMDFYTEVEPNDLARVVIPRTVKSTQQKLHK